MNVGLFHAGADYAYTWATFVTDEAGYFSGTFFDFPPDEVYRINPVTGAKGERFWEYTGYWLLNFCIRKDGGIDMEDPPSEGEGKSTPIEDNDRSWGTVKAQYR